MAKLTTFSVNGHYFPARFIETKQVKKGVECDVYEITGDSSRDLAIIRVQAGHKTPLQKVLKGKETIEGFLDGRAKLKVVPVTADSKPTVHSFNGKKDTGKEVVVSVGQIVQWAASKNTGFTFYEICTPPYEDGRFENLPE